MHELRGTVAEVQDRSVLIRSNHLHFCMLRNTGVSLCGFADAENCSSITIALLSGRNESKGGELVLMDILVHHIPPADRFMKFVTNYNPLDAMYIHEIEIRGEKDKKNNNYPYRPIIE